MQNLRQNKKIKIAILLLCICVLAFFAFSFAYELREADHICLGPDCAICVQLHQLATLRSQLLSVFSFGSVFCVCTIALLWACCTLRFVCPHCHPRCAESKAK